MPHLMYQKGSLNVLNIQPGHPMNLNCHTRFIKEMETCKSKDGKNVWTDVRRFLEATGSEAQELETG